MPQNWYWVNLPHTGMRLTDEMVETITTVEPVFMRKKSRKRNFRRENSIIWNFWGVNASADVYGMEITLIITMVDTQPSG